MIHVLSLFHFKCLRLAKNNNSKQHINRGFLLIFVQKKIFISVIWYCMSQEDTSCQEKEFMLQHKISQSVQWKAFPANYWHDEIKGMFCFVWMRRILNYQLQIILIQPGFASTSIYIERSSYMLISENSNQCSWNNIKKVCSDIWTDAKIKNVIKGE